jgi:hypothetical protein
MLSAQLHIKFNRFKLCTPLTSLSFRHILKLLELHAVAIVYALVVLKSTVEHMGFS